MRKASNRVCENNICITNGSTPTAGLPPATTLSGATSSGKAYGEARMQPSTPAWGAVLDYQPRARTGQPGTSPRPPPCKNKAAGMSTRWTPTPSLSTRPRATSALKRGPPALTLGFKNFPMQQFGVTKPALKAIAHTPRLPAEATADSKPSKRDPQVLNWLGVSVRNIAGQEEMSAFGLQGVSRRIDRGHSRQPRVCQGWSAERRCYSRARRSIGRSDPRSL